MGILAFIVVGFLAGLIARAIYPGRQSMGLVVTTLLGIVGSFIGGLIGSLVSSGGSVVQLTPSGLLFSVVGATVLLFLVQWAGRGRVRA